VILLPRRISVRVFTFFGLGLRGSGVPACRRAGGFFLGVPAMQKGLR
jgi:hypothetical protein